MDRACRADNRRATDPDAVYFAKLAYGRYVQISAARCLSAEQGVGLAAAAVMVKQRARPPLATPHSMRR
jgi:hypothetical protein